MSVQGCMHRHSRARYVACKAAVTHPEEHEEGVLLRTPDVHKLHEVPLKPSTLTGSLHLRHIIGLMLEIIAAKAGHRWWS